MVRAGWSWVFPSPAQLGSDYTPASKVLVNWFILRSGHFRTEWSYVFQMVCFPLPFQSAEEIFLIFTVGIWWSPLSKPHSFVGGLIWLDLWSSSLSELSTMSLQQFITCSLVFLFWHWFPHDFCWSDSVQVSWLPLFACVHLPLPSWGRWCALCLSLS